VGDFGITFKHGCGKCPFCVKSEYFPPYCNISATHPRMPKLEPSSFGIPDKCPLLRGDVVVRFGGLGKIDTEFEINPSWDDIKPLEQ